MDTLLIKVGSWQVSSCELCKKSSNITYYMIFLCLCRAAKKMHIYHHIMFKRHGKLENQFIFIFSSKWDQGEKRRKQWRKCTFLCCFLCVCFFFYIISGDTKTVQGNVKAEENIVFYISMYSLCLSFKKLQHKFFCCWGKIFLDKSTLFASKKFLERNMLWCCALVAFHIICFWTQCAAMKQEDHQVSSLFLLFLYYPIGTKRKLGSLVFLTRRTLFLFRSTFYSKKYSKDHLCYLYQCCRR